MSQLGVDDASKLLLIDADLVEDRPDNAFRFSHQRGQQMQRIDLRVTAIGCQFLSPLDGLLGFDSQLVESKRHDWVCSLRKIPGMNHSDTVERGLSPFLRRGQSRQAYF